MNELLLLGKDLIKKMHHAGFEAYIVGGAVRDYIRQVPINDIDIVTSATVQQINSIFPRTIHVGTDHETIIVRYKGHSFEVTPFRNLASNKPTSLKTDLMFRDFTMNAIAMAFDGRIIDPWKGSLAIKEKVIKAVDDGQARIEEDPLRMIRAFRFMSETGYLIEANTVHAISKNKHLLLDVAVERINQEWKKLLSGKNRSHALKQMYKLDIHHFLPVFQDYPSLFSKLLSQTENWNTLTQMIAYLHILKEDISISTWMKRWKCSNEDKKTALYLVKIYDEFQQSGMTDWLLYRLDEEYIDDFIHLNEMLNGENVLSKEKLVDQKVQLTIQNKGQLAIQPIQLIEMFPTYPKGKWIAKTIEQLEKLVITKQILNEEEKLKEWILCHPPEIN